MDLYQLIGFKALLQVNELCIMVCICAFEELPSSCIAVLSVVSLAPIHNLSGFRGRIASSPGESCYNIGFYF